MTDGAQSQAMPADQPLIPLLEDDLAELGLITPTGFTPQGDMPSAVVICFFAELIEQLAQREDTVEKFRGEKVAETEPATQVSWVLRRGAVGDTFGGGAADELPQRGALGQRAKQAVQAGLVDLVTGFRIESIEQVESYDAARVVLVAEDGRAAVPRRSGGGVDRFLGRRWASCRSCGSSWTRSWRRRCGWARKIDPNLHSCGSVSPHRAAELVASEPGLYLVGMKSYGRAPTFLAMTGYTRWQGDPHLIRAAGCGRWR